MNFLIWLTSLFGTPLDLLVGHGDEGADSDPDG